MPSTMAAQRRVPTLVSIRPLPLQRPSFRQRNPLAFASSQTRSIAQSYLAKVKKGQNEWAAKSADIQAGKTRHVWDILEERGYIKDVAGKPEQIKEIMRVKRIGAYVGIDPTADSLHIGHLLPMMPLFWLWFHGHPAALLIGGTTARIGDPTGRLESRENMSNGETAKNVTKMHYQLKGVWSNIKALKKKYNYEDDWAAKKHLLNNTMWLSGLSMLDFTKRLAKFVRIGPMLSRDTVKRKMTEGDGMSLGEFMYPLFQGWDFWHVYSKLGIQMQIGGSDQYGNIVAGIEALKTIRDSEDVPHNKIGATWDTEPVGFTVPLLTDSAGNKFGKSAGNAVWLDQFKTSAFELYGYFVRRSDDEVERLLKLFTFMPLPEIMTLMESHREKPSRRIAQHRLAFEVLSLVHGSQKAVEEAQQHEYRFGGKVPVYDRVPTEESGIVVPQNAPRSDIQLPRSIVGLSPAKILQAAGIVESGSEGQRLVLAKGAYIAGAPDGRQGLVPGNLTWTPLELWFPEETQRYVIDDTYLILRKGKYNVRIIELISDKEWEESGRFYNGQKYTGKLRLLKEEMLKRSAEQGLEIDPKDLNQMIRASVFGNKLTVANNEDIELPNKEEVRQRRQEEAQKTDVDSHMPW